MLARTRGRHESIQSVQIGRGNRSTSHDVAYIATFDVPAPLRDELAGRIGVSAETLRPTDRLVMHVLKGPPRVGVECVLGDVEQPADEAFVPLIIKRLKPPRVM